MNFPNTITLFYELENDKRHYRMHPLTQVRARTQFEMTITLNPTAALLPVTWHRYQLTPADIQKLQQKCDANLLYQHLAFYLFSHKSPVERVLDVNRDNRSIFAFRCGNSKPLFNLFMPMYIDYMVKHEPQWPFTEHRITSQKLLHSPPLPEYPFPIQISPHLYPMPSPFRQLHLSNDIYPCMITFPHRNHETIPFYPMTKERNRYLMIRLHDTLEDTAKKCIVNMPCFIYFESTNTRYVLGYEAFLLNPTDSCPVVDATH
jgi:hypothetical protein